LTRLRSLGSRLIIRDFVLIIIAFISILINFFVFFIDAVTVLVIYATVTFKIESVVMADVHVGGGPV
jgi:hypothetical protein